MGYQETALQECRSPTKSRRAGGLSSIGSEREALLARASLALLEEALTTWSQSRLIWRKASYSGTNGGGCVEVARNQGVVAVRDFKDPNGPALILSADQWAGFVARIRSGA
jgi:hypothetical protein